MSKKPENMREVCGNCRYHNTYDYPDRVFCFDKFSRRENPVVSVFHSCDSWEVKLQDCFCLQDSMRKRGKKTN